MTDLPEDQPREPIVSPREDSSAGNSPASPSAESQLPAPTSWPPEPWASAPEPRPAVPSFMYEASAPPSRIPNLGHVAFLVLVLLPLGLIVTGVVWAIAVHEHLYGATSLQGSATDIHYLLGSEAILYFATFIACLLIFPLFWHKSLFAGLQWNGATALRLRWRLAGAAFACFLLALLNQVLIPGPANAPIEKIFRTPGAAWLLFGFGVTIAPFFEETFFRGFLLPAFCTAFDWLAEALSMHEQTPWPLEGRPRWPLSARLVAAFVLAIPIAAISAFPRTGHYRLRVLIFAVWALALTLGWAIGRAEWKGRPHRFTTVDANGYPIWSIAAMAFSSILVSIPFALLHAQQTGYSIGPFLLLVIVSMVLCGVRLSTRSLASSVLVHSCYNFFLFSLMLIGTSGFRHMDKM